MVLPIFLIWNLLTNYAAVRAVWLTTDNSILGQSITPPPKFVGERDKKKYIVISNCSEIGQ
jgi:hypothetical protein